jgi:peptidoglycan/xylan/chitin deacetylase (PgdA/CDA1 family)
MKLKLKNFSAVLVVGLLLVGFVAFFEPRPCGYVSLTFDDGYKSHVNASKILDSYGYRGTFYVISGLTSFENHELMNRSDLIDIAFRGHEIGGHTLTHKNADNITREEFIHDVEDGKAALENIGISPISFAYPFGHGTEWSDAVKNAGYRNAKDGGYVANTLPPADVYRLSGVFPTQDNLPLIWSYINDTKKGYWLILGFHDIGPEDEIRSDIDLTDEEFTRILDELKSSCLNIVNVGDFAGRW